MARAGGLNDDDDEQSIVSLARRPVSQQRNNVTPDSPPFEATPAPTLMPQPEESVQPEVSAPLPPVYAVVAKPAAPTILATTQPDSPTLTPPPLSVSPVGSTGESASPLAAERRGLVGRPRKPQPRVLLRATVTKPNHEWVEQMWRTQLRADGSRYANMGEFIDELVTLARSRTGA